MDADCVSAAVGERQWVMRTSTMESSWACGTDGERCRVPEGERVP
jgi:hypothetical protein